MVAIEELNTQFVKVGLKVPTDVMEVCCEICHRQKVDEALLVDTWVAYSFTAFQEIICPDVEKLFIFERKEFGDPILTTPKQSKTPSKFAKKGNFTSSSSLGTPKRIDQIHVSESRNTPSMLKPSTPTTPVGLHTPSNCDTPVSGKSAYSSGQSMCTFGESNCNWTSTNASNSQVNLYEHSGLKAEFTWKTMYDKLSDVSYFVDCFCEDLANEIIKINNLSEPIPIYNCSIEPCTIIGRVVSDGSKVDPQNLLVEGFDDDVCLTVDVTQVKDYSLFPGQVIALEGVNDKKFLASNVYTCGKGTTPSSPDIADTLQIVVAAGPFSPATTLDFQALNSLLDHVKQNKPDLLFLIGPFFDSNSKALNDFNSQMFKYEDQMLKIFDEISSSLAGLGTKVYFISSYKDCNCIPVFPTPVIKPDSCQHNLLPDPALLDINGLIIGLTSVDIIANLSQEEITNCRGNRLARLAGHLTHQQSFYPLDSGPFYVPIDRKNLCTKGNLPVVPHILVVPSELHNFIKEIDGCVLINPEKCVKGNRANNFVRIEIRPADVGEQWTASTHISAKVVRI